MSNEQEILRQLGEIQRSIGETTATIAAMREDIKTEAQEAAGYRGSINETINNVLTRIAKLERDVSSLMMTVEKTVNPLIKNYSNAKERMIGFLSAWGMVFTGLGAIGGLLWWLFSGGLVLVAQYLTKLSGNNG